MLCFGKSNAGTKWPQLLDGYLFVFGLAFDDQSFPNENKD
jgi:hypothetical protein